MENDERSNHPLFADLEHPIVINVGKIEGGDWTSSVPFWCRFEIRVGIYPGWKREWVTSEIERCLLEAAAYEPFLARFPPRVRPKGQYGEGYVVENADQAVEIPARHHRQVFDRDLIGRVGTAPRTAPCPAASAPAKSTTCPIPGPAYSYAGRNGRLPKHFVARHKLCIPASVSYWINALGGTPLLCLHKALDPKLIKALEQDVVPHLQHLGVVPEAAPDLTKPDAGAPALTLVFDREGWSPDLFKRLARRGIACITWHKNFKGEDWPQDDFGTFEVPSMDPPEPVPQSLTSPSSRSYCATGSPSARFGAVSPTVARCQ